MGDRAARTSGIDKVQSRTANAEMCGHACYRADMDPADVKFYVETWGPGNMTAEERDAYLALSPAVFWQAFNRGWSRAKVESTVYEGHVDD